MRVTKILPAFNMAGRGQSLLAPLAIGLAIFGVSVAKMSSPKYCHCAEPGVQRLATASKTNPVVKYFAILVPSFSGMIANCIRRLKRFKGPGHEKALAPMSPGFLRQPVLIERQDSQNII